MQTASEQARQATTWAAGVLAQHGCTLHSVPGGAWDVETPKGWRAAEDWRELCQVAREVQGAKQ